MRKINFLFAVHLHQPVGNFDEVFEYATGSAYLPFLEIMHGNPDFTLAFHASGPLWEYWEKNNPGIFDLVGEMVERKQMELLGGGFYEPILAVIPRRDALAQIETMADYLDGKFGVRPRGIWLTERIWEPHLPGLLFDAGVEYTLADDYHFKCTGLVGEKLLGHYITEDSGHSVNIFPISQDLRYLIPFSKPDEAVDFLIRYADESGRRALVFGDDGEKFGLWPGTSKWVWDEGWMKKFVDGILSNNKAIKLRRFDEWIDENAPMGQVYLPATSYFEMGEWALPADLSARFSEKVESLRDNGEIEEWRPFLKGGFWRGFLTKYPESMWMHKRMLFASQKVLESESPSSEAAMALYRAQCNCAYWHGVFGGLYLPHLRRGIYDNILRAERLLAANRKEIEIVREDLDVDGFDEVFLAAGDLQIFIKPSDGGKIAEIDLLKFERNITDTLSRRPEGYHNKVKDADREHGTDATASIHDIVRSKEENLGRLLHYDWYNRRFLVDHFLGEGTTAESFRSGDFHEIGDFSNTPYDIILGPEEVSRGAKVVLRRNGGLFSGDHRTPVYVEKVIVLRRDGSAIDVKYIVKNPNNDALDVHFAVETHFSLMSRDNPGTHFHFPNDEKKKIRPGEIVEFDGIDHYDLNEEDDGFAIGCEFSKGGLWMWPVETISNSESGFERVYQETSLLHHWRSRIQPLEKFEVELSWIVRDI